jgi:hypothetical protein
VNWLPIDSAPKNGNTVLLAEGDYVDCGFWHDGSECHGHRGEAGWFSEDDRANLLIASNVHPTHWMPFPEPPSTGADTERHRSDKAVLSPDNAAMVASLVAERDSLKEDAERYRLLRDKCGDSSIGVFQHAWDSHYRTWLSGASLDAAIDAARKALEPR